MLVSGIVSSQTERAIVMAEQEIPLPADHAFVVQRQESQDCPESCRAGRIEHLATGAATRFTTRTELWDFVDKVLTDLTRRADESQNGLATGPRVDDRDGGTV
jgi:hypothetical protein